MQIIYTLSLNSKTTIPDSALWCWGWDYTTVFHWLFCQLSLLGFDSGSSKRKTGKQKEGWKDFLPVPGSSNCSPSSWQEQQVSVSSFSGFFWVLPEPDQQLSNDMLKGSEPGQWNLFSELLGRSYCNILFLLLEPSNELPISLLKFLLKLLFSLLGRIHCPTALLWEILLLHWREK